MYYSPVLNSLFSPYVPEHPALNTALQLCTVDLQLRPVQPAESPLCAKLFFTSWYGGQGRFRFEIVPGFSSAPIASGVWDRDRPGVFLYDHSDFPVWEGSLGILPLDTKSLECDIRVYCSPGVDSYDYGPERLIADIHIDKPITTAGSIHDAFPPRAIAESNLRRLFKPFLRFDEWTSTYALDLN
ncbi:MAG TPA: hypothetical protein VG711_11555, partial [Phycisphaerales bacterium]|nr:hypothetical protein [Phycisphaerales bacterium]